MQTKTFRAVQLTVADHEDRDALLEAFNAWAEVERPAEILDVHYFHDAEVGLRGYQIIFEDSWGCFAHDGEMKESQVPLI